MTIPVKDASGTTVTVPTLDDATGAPITGEALPSGTGLFGWLSYQRKLIADRLPAALVGSRLDVNVGNTPAVTIATLPLPAGAATSANQGTSNTSLATITTNTAQGTETTAATMPVGGVGQFGWLSAISYDLTVRLGTLGQKAMIGSTPVVLANNHSTIPVTLATGLNTTDDHLDMAAQAGVALGAATESILGLAGAARTTTQTIGPYVNRNTNTQIIVWLDITAAPGTDTVRLDIEAQTADGVWRVIDQDAAQAAVTTRTTALSSGASVATSPAWPTRVKNMRVPRNWRYRIVHSAATSFTYACGHEVM